jgi:NTE family protein
MTDVAIVLQGGGALGAFEAGVLEVVLEKGLNPVVVSGVSIGAVNAAALCAPRVDSSSGTAIDALQALWADLTAPYSAFSFVVPKMGQPWCPPWDAWYRLSVLNDAPLYDTLDKHIRFDDLRPGGPGPRCIVTSTNLVSGELEAFDSGKRALKTDHIVASTSLPVMLPPCSVPDPAGTFVDGGIYDNTPLKFVIDALEEDHEKVELLIVVNLFPSAATMPRNPIEYADRLLEITLSNKSGFDVKQARRVRDLAALLPEIEALIPDERREELADLRESHPDAFELLDKPVVFDRLVEITHEGHEPLGGIMDFSHQKLEQRRLEGRRAAEEQLDGL